MALELHSWPRSSGTRIAWALEELDLPYKYIEVDQKKQEHRSPAYLALNPHGKVPTLVDGEQVFFESAAILLHLGDKYGATKGLWPADDTYEGLVYRTPSSPWPVAYDASRFTSTTAGAFKLKFANGNATATFDFSADGRSSSFPLSRQPF